MAPPATIDFRCWYCNRRYWKPAALARTRLRCTCGHVIKVPRRSGRSSRVKTLTDWVVEVVVYGGGALLGFFLGIMIGSRLPFFRRSAYLIGGMTLFGAFGGERGVNWIGRMIREREQRGN